MKRVLYNSSPLRNAATSANHAPVSRLAVAAASQSTQAGVTSTTPPAQDFDSLVKVLEQQNDLIMQFRIKLEQLEKTVASNHPSKSKKAASPTQPKVIKKNPRGFIDYKRVAEPYRPPQERVRDWNEINTHGHVNPVESKKQAARCMDCGTPFCQTNTGCPVNNLIPEWNELVLNDQWKLAIDRLHATNNFPEFTGRVCPAPCEGACVAGLVDDAVTIKSIEYSIVEKAWEEGWIVADPPHADQRTGKSIGVVGSGPAGLAAADQLNKMGHSVTVYEREDEIGGLLMYGIPNMKLDKRQVHRRVNLLTEEGIVFQTNADVRTGGSIDPKELQAQHDAVVLTVGATKPRDLPVPGRDLKGVHFAMEFLTENQKDLSIDSNGDIKNQWGAGVINAQGKRVIVIGGGDTGTDCIGTSMRQYCKSVVNLEVMAEPPVERAANNPWPAWPRIFRTDYGHGEAKEVFGKDPRKFGVISKEFIDDGEGNVKGLKIAHCEIKEGQVVEVPGSEEILPCDLVCLAMGFVGAEETILEGFGLDADERGNVPATYGEYATAKAGVFAAGDCRRGQSLVVWAINEGRGVADKVNEFLTAEAK